MTNLVSIKSLGELKKDKDIDSWLRSKGIKVDFFDGKSLPFIITIEKDFTQSLLEKIESAVQSFLNLDSKYREKISGLVYENYKEMLGAADIKPLNVKEKSDIWKYVHPQEIYISQRNGGDEDEDIYIQVACNCDWEEEHGLQLVFKQGRKITRVSEQDGHLTNSDAFDTPDSEDKLLSAF